jgi:tubulin polyglutamylase TTLL1/tubulin monoglycylase TTLL3/8
MLITSVNGILKVYWYRDGYIRTSSEIYDLDDPNNEFIHLTNDAIQQKS